MSVYIHLYIRMRGCVWRQPGGRCGPPLQQESLEPWLSVGGLPASAERWRRRGWAREISASLVQLWTHASETTGQEAENKPRSCMSSRQCRERVDALKWEPAEDRSSFYTKGIKTGTAVQHLRHRSCSKMPEESVRKSARLSMARHPTLPLLRIWGWAGAAEPSEHACAGLRPGKPRSHGAPVRLTARSRLRESWCCFGKRGDVGQSSPGETGEQSPREQLRNTQKAVPRPLLQLRRSRDAL